VSQGSAATDLRWGENFNKFLFCNSLLNIVVKKLRKSVNICLSYRKNRSVSFFMAHSVVIGDDDDRLTCVSSPSTDCRVDGVMKLQMNFFTILFDCVSVHLFLSLPALFPLSPHMSISCNMLTSLWICIVVIKFKEVDELDSQCHCLSRMVQLNNWNNLLYSNCQC